MKDSIYREEYRRKLVTPQAAMDSIRDGHAIVIGTVTAEPPALLEAMAAKAKSGDLKHIKIYTTLPMVHTRQTVLDVELCDVIEAHTWFVSGSNRSLVRVGLNYYIPNYLHQLPRIIQEYMTIDLTVTTVSPMDKAGYFSFGASNDYISTAARCSRRIVVEVNENMPRVFGESLLHVSEVDAIVENHVPLIELPSPDPEPEDDIIGSYIAEMIPDGATIQLGIGGLPNAVAKKLLNHKDLGIHTELFCSSMIDLIEKGAVTGRKKTLHPRKNVFTFSAGDRRTYECMNDNPSMESYPASYVNDPAVIARNHNMISVNSVLEVDLLGQCNAESMGGFQFSGTGGQLDFVRGAFNAPGGKSILAFYSTAKNGEVSRILPQLASGSVITTPRMDTHYLATEFGVVNLKGKSTRDRALDIISLAHPRFRDDLLKEAEQMYLL